MSITRRKISRLANVSGGHLSDLLNGRKPVGKATAKKISAVTGRPWHFYLAMPPEAIQADLLAAIAEKKDEGGKLA